MFELCQLMHDKDLPEANDCFWPIAVGHDGRLPAGSRLGSSPKRRRQENIIHLKRQDFGRSLRIGFSTIEPAINSIVMASPIPILIAVRGSEGRLIMTSPILSPGLWHLTKTGIKRDIATPNYLKPIH